MSTLKVGEILPSKTYLINRAALVVYANASGDHNPIHQNEEFAKSVGLENVIAHGMYTMGLVGQYLSSIAGVSSKVREFSTRFTKPVVVPENVNVELIVSATVVEIDNGLAKLEISATCNEIKVLGMTKAVIAI
jgi:acyl dehydratase